LLRLRAALVLAMETRRLHSPESAAADMGNQEVAMAAKKKTAAKPKTAKKAAAAPAASAAKPKFGSPAWDAKYGIKKKTKAK
jgi:hypothetical protein